MENLAVNITNLQVSFGNQLELSIDSLRVYQQDRIGIIGENGVGKSTLLKLIAGMVSRSQKSLSKSKKTVMKRYLR